ncbi:MAG: hypothetical protein U0807_17540 [Candidatus Binatia bacterium]
MGLPESERDVRGPVVAALLVALSLALSLAVDARAARLTVCTLSFHSADEVGVFRSHLPPADFDVVDLSPHLLLAETARARPGGRSTPWLPSLCRPDLQCDVVVYSAEFAGRFFGGYGASLSLQEMEEASCQPQCAGLFHRPREVFLLACNTLATKDEDSRSPGEYLQVLLDHGFDRASAERVVALRYGPLGPSFREALRRIFMGVPRLYGFASVAPLGDRTAPLLERYFRSKGDYRRYLEQAARDSALNRELLAAFAGTGLVQSSGLTALEPAAADRGSICALYDENEPVVRRLGIIQGLMARPDLLAFLPSIQVFVDRHPPEQMQGEARRLFEEIRGNEDARWHVLRLVRELNVSALELELAHLALHLEWMTAAEFRRLAVDGARELLRRRLTSEVVDIMCEISKHERIGDAFASDDLPEPLFQHPEGIRLVDCLSPADGRVSARLVPHLDDADVSARLWAAYALSRRLPLADVILVTLARHLADPSTDLRERLAWIFRTQRPLSDDVRAAVRASDPGLAGALQARGRR